MDKVLNETIAMDLKHWSDDLRTGLLHTVDYVTQYSVSCIVRPNKKEVILQKVFKNLVSMFGCPKKSGY